MQRSGALLWFPQLFRLDQVCEEHQAVYEIANFRRRSIERAGGGGSTLAISSRMYGAAVPLKRTILAPAERADILIDFSSMAGQRVNLISDSFNIMQFRVAPSESAALAAPAIPARLHDAPRRIERDQNTPPHPRTSAWTTFSGP